MPFKWHGEDNNIRGGHGGGIVSTG